MKLFLGCILFLGLCSASRFGSKVEETDASSQEATKERSVEEEKLMLDGDMLLRLCEEKSVDVAVELLMKESGFSSAKMEKTREALRTMLASILETARQIEASKKTSDETDS